MKVIHLLTVLFSFCSALPVSNLMESYGYGEEIDTSRYLLMKNDLGDLEMVDLLSEPVTYESTKEDVTFYLYTKDNFQEPMLLNENNVVNSTYFDPRKLTFFIIHGWRDDYFSELNGLIKGSILELFHANVIVVDWSPASKRNYITAMLSVKSIGETVGGFINFLANELSMDLKQFGLVGHSLGAHVSGNAGAAVDGKIDFIVGLDPAGPLFSVDNIDNRLDDSDADYVEVIHTSLLLGFRHPLGHIDFYPNGGMRQPGCGLDIDFVCAHSRSYEYYAESLKRKFLGHACTSYGEFEAGRCENTEVAIMGQLEPRKARGKYYLKTNEKEPFVNDT